ncbi:hypothetical protein [Rhodococcus opacus]|uniref:hypothetical protein n=1 Tax=Rhodococcus opacus TaxID=37919 RepID=UPI001C44FD88|nr:hypothetical protein [Rhodococcus opacus]MBV6758368.1 hypothetical protein [Rhodococcus opacus]
MPVNVAASDARVRLRSAVRAAARDVHLHYRAELGRELRGTFGAAMDIAAAGDLGDGPVSASPADCADWLLAVHVIAPAYLDPHAEGLLTAHAAARAQAYPQDTAPTPAREARAGTALAARVKTAQHLATAAEIETLTAVTGERVKASTVRVWASRGKLAGVEIQGRTVYRLGDVVRLVRERDERAAAA